MSERNERQAVMLLITALENQLRSMPTTLELDEAIAEAGYPSMSDTVVQAVRFRVVRKRKLVEAIDAMKARLNGMAASV
jgi:metal-responsive CopG/Arc/MetJ family transcriptional regulator